MDSVAAVVSTVGGVVGGSMAVAVEVVTAMEANAEENWAVAATVEEQPIGEGTVDLIESAQTSQASSHLASDLHSPSRRSNRPEGTRRPNCLSSTLVRP